MSKLLLPRPKVPVITGDGTMTQEWRRWFEDGGAILAGDAKLPSGALPDDIVVGGTGNAGKLYLGADGVPVSFGGTFGIAPKRIEADITGLPALPPGNAYDIRATNITATGFLPYAKSSVVLGIVDQSTGAGVAVAGSAAWVAQKPTIADAFDQAYMFEFSGQIPRMGLSSTGDYDSPSYEVTFSGSYLIEVFLAGAWHALETSTVIQTETQTVPAEFFSFFGHTAAVIITEAVGQAIALAPEFRVTPIGLASITEFAGVAYQTQASLPPITIGPQMLKWWVYV